MFYVIEWYLDINVSFSENVHSQAISFENFYFYWVLAIGKLTISFQKINWPMRNMFFDAVLLAFLNRLIYMLWAFDLEVRKLFCISLKWCWNLCWDGLMIIQVISEFSLYTVRVYIGLLLRLGLILNIIVLVFFWRLFGFFFIVFRLLFILVYGLRFLLSNNFLR